MAKEEGDDEDTAFWRRGPRIDQTHDLVNARSGELQDYQRFPGDNPPSYFAQQGEADRWGNRILMEINQPGGAKTGPVDVQPLVDIRTLKKTVPIDLQLRFALPDANGSPVLPFSTVWPFALGVGHQLVLTVRRTADPLSAPTEDTLIVAGFGSRVFPWDIFTSRTFQVVASFSDAYLSPLPSSVWVEAIATQVTNIASRSQIEGWGLIKQNAFIPASLASTQLLEGRADRRQFVICNTSTTGNLYLNFNNIASTTPQAVMVLPANAFATYESPPGGFTGNVFGVWDDDTNGGALVTDGVYGSPGVAVF